LGLEQMGWLRGCALSDIGRYVKRPLVRTTPSSTLSTSVVLPIPASPETKATWRRPLLAVRSHSAILRRSRTLLVGAHGGR